jgi:hypothetical protein
VHRQRHLERTGASGIGRPHSSVGVAVRGRCPRAVRRPTPRERSLQSGRSGHPRGQATASGDEHLASPSMRLPERRFYPACSYGRGDGLRRKGGCHMCPGSSGTPSSSTYWFEATGTLLVCCANVAPCLCGSELIPIWRSVS